MKTSPEIALVGYGSANIMSVKKAFSQIELDARIVSDPKEVGDKKFDVLILPGVGHFTNGARSLLELGMGNAIQDAFSGGTKIIGICLGMQLLFESSAEGKGNGLGFLRGRISHVRDHENPNTSSRINTGWFDTRSILNNVESSQNGPYYFTHSYGMDKKVAMENTDLYGISVIEDSSTLSHFVSDQLVGVQFHPERSFKQGRTFLKNTILDWA
jgi:glutamine amidotransferase